MSRILLVDDEKLARDRLKRMLDSEGLYDVVGEASNGVEAIAQIKERQPDIVLMDIRMPGMDGMEAAQHIIQMEIPPAIIFCTAYDEYAINAFQVQAIGYVLKPVRKAQLFESLKRAEQLSQVQLAAVAESQAERTHLSVKTGLGIEVISLDEISHFMAEQKYVTAYRGGREIIIDETLKQLEDEFQNTFIRIHRNCLVGVSYVEGLIRNKAGQNHIKIKNTEQLLAVSRRHLSLVKQRIQAI